MLKRAYEAPAHDDGYRVLVDRLWPRGIKKEDLVYDEWCKNLTPSAELRKAYHGEVIDFPTFCQQRGAVFWLYAEQCLLRSIEYLLWGAAEQLIVPIIYTTYFQFFIL